MRNSPMPTGGRNHAEESVPNRSAFQVSRHVPRRLLPAVISFILSPSAKPILVEPPLTKSPCKAQPEPCAKDARIEIEDKVKHIVIGHLGVDEAKVTESARLIDDLGADSLDTVELAMAFEEEFGAEIPDEVAEKIVTVKDAIDLVAAQRCGLAP